MLDGTPGHGGVAHSWKFRERVGTTNMVQGEYSLHLHCRARIWTPKAGTGKQKHWPGSHWVRNDRTVAVVVAVAVAVAFAPTAAETMISICSAYQLSLNRLQLVFSFSMTSLVVGSVTRKPWIYRYPNEAGLPRSTAHIQAVFPPASVICLEGSLLNPRLDY